MRGRGGGERRGGSRLARSILFRFRRGTKGGGDNAREKQLVQIVLGRGEAGEKHLFRSWEGILFLHLGTTKGGDEAGEKQLFVFEVFFCLGGSRLMRSRCFKYLLLFGGQRGTFLAFNMEKA